MNALATKQSPEQAWSEVGTVVDRSGAQLTLRSRDVQRAAQRAPSCLLQPEVGDRVLVALTEGGEAFVVAVLEREDGEATLVVEGDARLEARDGRLSLIGGEGVEVASGRSVGVLAPEVRIRARRAEVLVDALALVGGMVDAQLEKARLVATTAESVVDSCVQRAKRVYRFVEQLDRLRAEQVDYVAEGRMNLRGENTLVTARELVKVDGSQIHVG